MNDHIDNGESPSAQWRADTLAERRERRAQRRFVRKVALIVLAVAAAAIQRAF